MHPMGTVCQPYRSNLHVNGGAVAHKCRSRDKRWLLWGQEGHGVHDVLSRADASQWVRVLQVLQYSHQYIAGTGSRLEVGAYGCGANVRGNRRLYFDMLSTIIFLMQHGDSYLTLFTRMPLGPNSNAIHLVNISIAHLAKQ